MNGREIRPPAGHAAGYAADSCAWRKSERETTIPALLVIETRLIHARRAKRSGGATGSTGRRVQREPPRCEVVPRRDLSGSPQAPAPIKRLPQSGRGGVGCLIACARRQQDAPIGSVQRVHAVRPATSRILPGHQGSEVTVGTVLAARGRRQPAAAHGTGHGSARIGRRQESGDRRIAHAQRLGPRRVRVSAARVALGLRSGCAPLRAGMRPRRGVPGRARSPLRPVRRGGPVRSRRS